MLKITRNGSSYDDSQGERDQSLDSAPENILTSGEIKYNGMIFWIDDKLTRPIFDSVSQICFDRTKMAKNSCWYCSQVYVQKWKLKISKYKI